MEATPPGLCLIREDHAYEAAAYDDDEDQSVNTRKHTPEAVTSNMLSRPLTWRAALLLRSEIPNFALLCLRER